MMAPDPRVQFDLIVPVLYSFRYPAGIGKSKLKLKLKTPGTGRNWNVVTALAGMASA